MGKPTSKIELHCDAGNQVRLFDFDHAQNTLRIQARKKLAEKGYSCWYLPKNSKFIFENGSLRKKSNNGANKASTKEG
jgi:hypothetical protein